MNYYTFHIGDYTTRTMHLTPLQDVFYRRLMDQCYIREGALPLNLREIYELVRARRGNELACVRLVLKQFFTKEKDGYHNKRADAEILRFKAKGAARAAAANVRWHSNPGADSGANGMQLHTPPDANASLPIPNPQQPTSNNTHSLHGDGLPPDWRPDEDTLAKAIAKRPDLDIELELRKFLDHPSTKRPIADPEAWFLGWVTQGFGPRGIRSRAKRKTRFQVAMEAIEREDAAEVTEYLASGNTDPEAIAKKMFKNVREVVEIMDRLNRDVESKS